ncbi:MAG: hypothetical protein WCJ35_09735 [Planctomycetota bacterium]
MFLDTSGLFSLYDADDKYYSLASSLFVHSHIRVTTNYVFTELAALMIARKVSQDRMAQYLDDIQEDSRLEIIWIGRELHQAGMDLLRRRLDKTYSLCDVVSFTVMKDFGITEALTTDRHFEQEGLIRLLK